MTRIVSLAMALLLAVCSALRSQDAAIDKPLRSEKLSAAEGKAIRKAIISQGPVVGSGSLKGLDRRILFVPKAIEAAYAKKPEATLELLLKIVEGGEPKASIHASACINALAWGPGLGYLATLVHYETWDDPFADGETWREIYYDVCVRLIAKRGPSKAGSTKD